MKFTTIIVFLIPVVVARHHHRTLLETILRSKGNFFTKVNDDIQNMMNSLFESLNLAKTFLEKTRIKLLLTMHYDLNSVSEKNFDVYETMKDVAKISTGNKTKNNTILFELIYKILDGKYFDLSDSINLNNQTYKSTKQKNKTEPEFRNSKEFNTFIQDFRKKIDGLSLKNFSAQPPILPVSEKEDNITAIDFEVWQPPADIELDYVNDTESRRIYRGKGARIKKFPFIVSIHYLGAFACAGSIISKDLIITGASCLQLLYNNRFFRENPRAVSVRIGSDYYFRGGDFVDVIETYFHPSYDPKTLKDNLVILRLHRTIHFQRKQKNVRRILYDNIPAHLPGNTDGVLILGWGARRESQIITPHQKLMVARLDIYPLNECSQIYSKHYVTDKHFCAGFITSGGGACNKDLGGPGIVGEKLVGVISFGSPHCGAIDAPTVFTKLGYYSNWIDSIMRLRPPVIGVRTSTRLPIRSWHQFESLDDPRFPLKPINKETYRATNPENPEDIPALRNVLKELAQYNNSLLHDILYGDPKEDLKFEFDMFNPTEKIDPLQHLLVNKSLFIVPEIHTVETGLADYKTIPLTTSSRHSYSPTTASRSTGRTVAITHAPVMVEELAPLADLRTQPTIADKLYEYDDTGNYEIINMQSTKLSGRKDLGTPPTMTDTFYESDDDSNYQI